MGRYSGEGRGRAMEATQAAIEDAWQKAKQEGKHGQELKVVEWYVRGENPINWSRVVLSDEG
jgi:formate-dependent phosphoribosylglycinamide formyltransferase (GAR transformylase)